MDSVEVAFWKRGAAVKCVVQMHLHTKMMLALQKKKRRNSTWMTIQKRIWMSAHACCCCCHRSSGKRVGYADQILGFDCGGQQWVLEVALPVGSYSSATSSWRSKNT